MHARMWNVYDQKKGQLNYLGKISGWNVKEALDNARRAYHLRWPVVHRLDSDGHEV